MGRESLGKKWDDGGETGEKSTWPLSINLCRQLGDGTQNYLTT